MRRCTSRAANTRMRWTHPTALYDGALAANYRTPAVRCEGWRLRETVSIAASVMVISSPTISAVVIRCGRPDSQKPTEGLQRLPPHQLRGTGWSSLALPELSELAVASLQDWMEPQDVSCGRSRWLRPATFRGPRHGRREYASAGDRSGRHLVLIRVPDPCMCPPEIPARISSATTGPAQICIRVRL